MNSDEHKTWKFDLVDTEDGSGDAFLILPDDFLIQFGWNIGDTLSLEAEKNKIILTKL